MARIIVVEADQLIRGLIVEWLGAEGYAVAAYAKADLVPNDEADLVIVDIVMPRHGGCAKLRDLQSRHPKTPLIAISGQFTPGSSGPSTAGALGVRQVIGKPFTRDQLIHVVGEVLGFAAPGKVSA